ncbi:hypothetical protein [Rhodococcoides fascians]|uniref:hypothetical protein n=1 Tax=Rhodococcoides fascians TaxID=1828 RepID=UPI001DB52FD3|nr:hypothetical protein [Rhodococcus fascians]CAH0318376.1 hypothetical protein SRABI91_05275 [Rhodococcus fascians]
MVLLLLVALVIGGIYLFRRDHPVEQGPVNIALKRVAWALVTALVVAALIHNAVTS